MLTTNLRHFFVRGRLFVYYFKAVIYRTKLLPVTSNYLYQFLIKSTMMNYLIKRSRSLDLNLIPRESYLGRWSRETTPKDSQQRYERNIRRSYTPAREIGSFKV
uniref:Uncharacterized protein n=1 Tax=Elaeophora elaphi TaxID=1147741 RepID=A0A0R3RMY5_9BILA